jgi:excisionase family DNA binding protein
MPRRVCAISYSRRSLSTTSDRLSRPRASHGLRGAGDSSDSGEHRPGFPLLLTVDEAAELLRTTRRAIYAMVERHQLPGVIRVRRRVLFRADDLLHWLDQKRAPSPGE